MECVAVALERGRFPPGELLTAANIGDLQWRVIFLINLPIVDVAFSRYEQALTQRGGTPLGSPPLFKVPGPERAEI